MDRGTKIRTLVLGIALINQALVSFGFNPIPGDQDTWYDIASIVFTFVTAAIAWFKDNAVTAKGKRQQKYLKDNGLK